MEYLNKLLTIGVMLGINVNCEGRERLFFCCSSKDSDFMSYILHLKIGKH